MPAIKTYTVDTFKRRLLTPQNLIELGITEDMVKSLLGKKPELLAREVVSSSGDKVSIWPEGLSINETKFGKYDGSPAAELGWMAYLEIGAPLIEERADIIQPPADVLSTRAYENRGAESKHFEDAISFSIENTISWSLSGTTEFPLEGHIGSELQAQLEQSLEQSHSHTDIQHNHKDDQGTETQDESTTSTTNTATGVASGTGDLTARLLLSITGSISGTVTTSWGSTSTVSGDIPGKQRVETMAIQRRQIKQYTYEFPITFAGLIALQYAQPVEQFTDDKDIPKPKGSTVSGKIVSRDINSLELVEKGKEYRAKGVAETVSTLDVDHIIFENKPIPVASDQTFTTARPHYL